MNKQDGLTLVELIGVVVILAILLGVAIPNYQRTKERSYRLAAKTVLAAIYSGERAYCFTKNNRQGYYAVAAGAPHVQWDPIFMDNPNQGSRGITYTISGVTSGPNLTCYSATFTATATRSGGQCDDQTLQVTASDSKPTGNWDTCLP